MMTGRDIRDYRIRMGVSLREVAKHCSVSAQHIGDVERGRRAVTAENEKDICRGIFKANAVKRFGDADTSKDKS